MNFSPFDLVEWQSRHEASSTYSLADSGCQPARLSDVVSDPADLEEMLNVDQGYGDLAGSDLLRGHIAAWHGASATDVLVTVGGTEANAIVLEAVVEPGGHAVVVMPGYPQLTGCLNNRGVRVDTVALEEARGWQLSIDQLMRAVRADTRAIVVTHPNNPTGAVLSEHDICALVSAAARVGAWLVVDEVHRGTEAAGAVTSTLWGRYDRVVCVGSMSKAFALPGIRIGWVVAPAALREQVERRHHYATIAPAKFATAIAERAFTTPVRERLLNRTRRFVRVGSDALRVWVDASDGLLSMVDPVATASGFVRYHLSEGSLEIADAIRRAGVLVIPGAHFGVEHHLRITHGVEPEYLAEALQRISAVLGGLRRCSR
nr:aminotransferase class I/II-fold pyridoxal phosphate-dependent enzyme [Rhodoferax sp.]